MPKERSAQYDSQDQVFWDSGQEHRKAKAAKERCKSRKKTSIQRGINDYFDRSKQRRSMTDSFDDFEDWDDEWDEFEY